MSSSMDIRNVIKAALEKHEGKAGIGASLRLQLPPAESRSRQVHEQNIPGD